VRRLDARFVHAQLSALSFLDFSTEPTVSLPCVHRPLSRKNLRRGPQRGRGRLGNPTAVQWHLKCVPITIIVLQNFNVHSISTILRASLFRRFVGLLLLRQSFAQNMVLCHNDGAQELW
jgi:hypothetical protein